MLARGIHEQGSGQGGQDIAYLSHIVGCVAGIVVALILLKLKLVEPTEQEWTVIDLLRRDSKITSIEKQEPVAVTRLHVRLPSGTIKHLPVHEFIRHEQQGKSVNQFLVSEDCKNWTTYGEWRRRMARV